MEKSPIADFILEETIYVSSEVVLEDNNRRFSGGRVGGESKAQVKMFSVEDGLSFLFLKQKYITGNGKAILLGKKPDADALT